MSVGGWRCGNSGSDLSMIATDDLIALASSYYPAIGDPDLQTPEEWRHKFVCAPETKALRRKQQHAAENHTKWRSFVVDMHKALPDHRVRDESRLELDASYAGAHCCSRRWATQPPSPWSTPVLSPRYTYCTNCRRLPRLMANSRA